MRSVRRDLKGISPFADIRVEKGRKNSQARLIMAPRTRRLYSIAPVGVSYYICQASGLHFYYFLNPPPNLCLLYYLPLL